MLYTPENKDIFDIFMSIVSLFSKSIDDCLYGVMLSVLTSSVEECRFDLPSGKSKDNKFSICGFFTEMTHYYTKDAKSQSYAFCTF